MRWRTACHCPHAVADRGRCGCKIWLYGRCKRALNCQIDRCPCPQETGPLYIPKVGRWPHGGCPRSDLQRGSDLACQTKGFRPFLFNYMMMHNNRRPLPDRGGIPKAAHLKHGGIAFRILTAAVDRGQKNGGLWPRCSCGGGP